MKANANADFEEKISLYVSQLNFLHTISVQQPHPERHIPDTLIMEVLQKINKQISTLHHSEETNNDLVPAVLNTVGTPSPKKCVQTGSHSSFQQRLKHAMKAAGLTQKELAERAGVSQGFVSKLATGKITDSRNIYIKLIADALGVSFGWLHYGTGEMYPANFSADNCEV
ncbi:TPA: helix-turn-helix domain-containing protein [Vibrio vulnificus]|nr:helix-turn-helix domain-containing protein [Vibrio vulnificus]